MNRLLLILTLMLCSYSWSKADDIRDFQIEGMSIGDSLLDYFSKDQINNKKKIYYPESDKFFQINFKNTGNFTTYDQLQILIKKNDNNFIIYEFSGSVYYKKKIKDCYIKEKEVIEDIKNFTDPDHIDTYPKSKHKGDKTGRSTKTVTQFYFDTGGLIKVSCFDWSKFMEDKGDIDAFRVSIASDETFDWFINEAYK